LKTQLLPRRTLLLAGLNRSILDQGWSDFRRMLEYKQERRGGKVIAVPPKYTSMRCSSCKFVSAENRKTQAKFNCSACGFAENADFNAACNILAAGLAVLACGEMAFGTSVKQKPTFGTMYCA
jgi:putative transposase